MVQTIETLRRLLYDSTEEGKAEAVRLAKITPDPIVRANAMCVTTHPRECSATATATATARRTR
jgi:hypothetical protein